jgi:Flp pilus assembly secretin CpaC
MRRTLFAALTLLSAVPAHAAGVSVMLDEVRTVTFPKAITTIYVGNPSIADINMIDSRHAFIMGKGYGSTNMLALDQNGKQVSNIPISVLSRQNATITLQAGVAGRVTYTCTSLHCETAPQPGDDKSVFENSNSEMSTHASSAKTAANQ